MAAPIDGKTLHQGTTMNIPNYTAISGPQISYLADDSPASSNSKPGFGSIQRIFNPSSPSVRSSPTFGQLSSMVDRGQLPPSAGVGTKPGLPGKMGGGSTGSTSKQPFSAINSPFSVTNRTILSAPGPSISGMINERNSPSNTAIELDFGDDTSLVVNKSDPSSSKTHMPSIRITNRVHTTNKGGLTVPKPEEIKLTESGKIKKHSGSRLPITVNETGIVGSYSNDLDIKALHVTVVAFMEKYFENQLTNLMEQYTSVNAKLDTPQPVNRKVSLANEYHRLRGQIRDAQVKPKIDQFNTKVLGVLAKYSELGPLTEQVDIDEEPDYGASGHYQKKKSKIGESSARHSYRHDIIGEYLGILRSFCPVITITRDQGKHCRGDCGNCGANVHQTAINEGEPTMCPNCGMEVLLLVSGPRTSDSGPTTKTDQYGNWNTTVYPYYLAIQGRNNSQLNEDDYQRIKEELYRKGFDPNIISQLPPDQTGRRGNVNISDISAAMAAIGYSRQLNDVYNVARTLFNWNLPDLAEYDIRFEELYRLSQDAIVLIKESTDTAGTSSMNAAYRVWWLLSVLEIQLDKNFLGVVTTPKILERYLQIRLQVDKALGWTDPGINFYPDRIGTGKSIIISVD